MSRLVSWGLTPHPAIAKKILRSRGHEAILGAAAQTETRLDVR